MYILRNPQVYDPEIYDHQYDHTMWPDHVARVQKTIEFARKNLMYGRVADLSCGDGTIALALNEHATLGDFSDAFEHWGEIDVTINDISYQDAFICTETLEHLPNPLKTLFKIRQKTRRLLLSTPVHAPGVVDQNQEHLWTWDRWGVEAFLIAADFSVLDYEEHFFGVGYHYGLWACQ